MKRFLLLVAVMLSACGGGGGSDGNSHAQAAAERASVKPTELRVIGNSLTLHPASVEVGWPNNWGMAASAQDKDFAHLTAATLGIPVNPSNFADLERQPANNVSRIPEMTSTIGATTLVVVELGDNVVSLADFEPAYSKLLDSTAKAQKLICLSTWWEVPAKDAVINRQCAAHGGTYLYIGDIYQYPANPDRQEKQWTALPFIDSHPHDWGMARIAERIAALVK